MDIDEFVSRLDAVRSAYPNESERALQKGARKMMDAVKEASPDSKKDHKRKIKKSWKLSMAGLRAESVEAQIYSTSPHFHLVERGYVMKTLGGRVKGYKQGTFFFKKTVEKNIDDITEDIHETLFHMVEDKL